MKLLTNNSITLILLIFIMFNINSIGIYGFSNQSTYTNISSPVDFIQQDFDVLNYDITLDLTQLPKKNTHGKCKILFRWVNSDVNRKFYFHLRDLNIDSAKYITYNNNKEYSINPVEVGEDTSSTYHWEITESDVISEQDFVDFDTVEVTIFYSGTMTYENNSAAWGGVSNTSNIVFSLGVGFFNNYVSSTQHWLPCYDHPSDKATFTGRFIVPAGQQCASIGELECLYLDNGTDVYIWTTKLPCATYLYTFAAGDYLPMYFEHETVPIVVYSRATDTIASRFAYQKVPQMIDAYQKYFGKFPFEKVGYVNTTKGSMEHQTMISLELNTIKSTYSNKDTISTVVAHELSHQWFGDLVTCQDFRNAWLNEGFATFCQSIWEEYLSGFNAFLNLQSDFINNYIDKYAAQDGILPLYDYSRSEPSSNYPFTIYYKGGAVLGMLRYELGDEVFFNAVKSYLNKYAYNVANTNDLKNVFEDISKQDLSWFFDQWVYGLGYPIISIDYTKAVCNDKNLKKLIIKINQIQKMSDIVYQKLPVEIDFIDKNKNILFSKIFTINKKNNEFVVDSVQDFDDIIINKGSKVRALLKVAEITNIDNEINNNNKQNLILYPNPSDDKLIIKLNKVSNKPIEVSIYNLYGEQVYSTIINSIEKNDILVNTKDIPTGAYLIKIKSCFIYNETINIIH